MKPPKERIYAQLTAGQVTLISGRDTTVQLLSQIDSYVGPKQYLEDFRRQMQSLRELLQGWASAEYWLTAFSNWANSADASEVRPATMRTRVAILRNGLVKYVEECNLQQMPIAYFDGKFLVGFADWLKNQKNQSDASMPLSIGTQKKYYDGVCLSIRALQQNSKASLMLAPNIDFPSNPYPRASAQAKPTRRLDDYVWKKLYAECRKEAMEILEDTKACWNAMDENKPFPTDYRTCENVRLALYLRYKELIPSGPDIRAKDRYLYNAINRVGGYCFVIRPFQPNVRSLMPFILLLGIYLAANTGPLLRLKVSEVERKEIMDVMRTVFGIEKPRGTDYERSFVIDEDDFLSPSSIASFIKQWCARLRNIVRCEEMFVFFTSKGNARPFLEAHLPDVTWSHNLKAFLQDIGLPSLSMREIRMTGLDAIRMMTNNDLRAVAAAGGQSGSEVLRTHYEGDAARMRMNEDLSEGMLSMVTWVGTNGAADHRPAAPSTDILCATPGWGCADPFDSPIAGESKGRACRAYGVCPSCPMGTLDTSSALSLARSLQLLEEVKQAREYLPLKRWKTVFKPVGERLENFWLPQFRDKAVCKAASRLNLSAIGKLE